MSRLFSLHVRPLCVCNGVRTDRAGRIGTPTHPYEEGLTMAENTPTPARESGVAPWPTPDQPGWVTAAV